MMKQRVTSGITGLDEVLYGGFVPLRGYLIRGCPGTGKTTLGMYFLAAGAKQGENGLFITLGESQASLQANAAGIGLDTQGIDFLDLSPHSDFFAEFKSYDLFAPADVELSPMTEKIIAKVKQLKPQRVFLDGIV